MAPSIGNDDVFHWLDGGCLSLTLEEEGSPLQGRPNRYPCGQPSHAASARLTVPEVSWRTRSYTERKLTVLCPYFVAAVYCVTGTSDTLTHTIQILIINALYR